jgi:ribonuclease BN (tRNA processing enzyme)
VRFTVLGKSPAWQDAGGACSSYLVEEGEYRLLVDCGNGAFAKLRQQLPYSQVDEVLISHMHADHVSDLVPFAFARKYGLPPDPSRARPRLWLPPAGAAMMRAMVALPGSDGLIDDAFDVAEYEPNATLALGPLGVALHEVPHYVLTHAIGLTAPGGGRLVYGADCRAGSELEAAARGADVLIAEATLPWPDPAGTPERDRGHMSAGEAAAVAQRAGVGRLVLTHISDQLDSERALTAAREEFDGPVELAAEGSAWEL